MSDRATPRERLCDRCIFADIPQGTALGLAGGNGRIDDEAVLEGGRKRFLHDGLQRCLATVIGNAACRVAAADFHQHIHRAARCQRLRDLRKMVEDDMQDIGRDQLERLNPAARRRLQTVQQLDGRRHVAHFGERGGARHRLRKQLHRRGGDHAKRSFGADEEVPQIITRIVLAKPAKQVQDAAAHQHHLDTKGQLARCSVTNDIQPAGIGPQIAADGAASLPPD